MESVEVIIGEKLVRLDYTESDSAYRAGCIYARQQSGGWLVSNKGFHVDGVGATLELAVSDMISKLDIPNAAMEMLYASVPSYYFTTLKQVHLKFRYFKESGKYYANGKCVYTLPGKPSDPIYPREFGELLNSEGKLPGLQSGTWDGPFTVKVCGSYTELCLPKK